MDNKLISQFWLQIKPAYIIENFENLISYLQVYNYDPDVEDNNADYNATADTMIRMSDDYATKILNSPIDLPHFDISIELLVRLLAATILAAKKRNESVNKIIIALFSVIFRINKKLTDTHYEKFASIIFKCAKGYKLNFAGYKFSHLELGKCSLDLFTSYLTFMTFITPDEDYALYGVDHKGVALLGRSSVLNIYPGNMDSYSSSAKTDFINIEGLINFQLPKDSSLKTNSFANLYQVSNDVVRSLDSIKPTLRRLKSNYGLQDEFIVEIIEKRNAFVLARTIDPAFNEIVGKLNLLPKHSMNRPSRMAIQNQVQAGDFVRVTLDEQDEFAFRLAETFESFYQHTAVLNSDLTAIAVFESVYSEGYTFVTDQGIRMSIFKNNTTKYSQDQNDALAAAMNDHLPVKVKFLEARCKPNDPKFYLYGHIDWSGIIYDSEEDFFDVEMADASLVDAFLEDCAEEASNIIENSVQEVVDVDPLAFSPVVSILVNFQRNGFNSSRARLENATAGRVLAEILGIEAAAEFFENERKLTHRLVEFANGELSHHRIISAPGNTPADRELLEVLNEYIEVTDSKREDPADMVGKIRKLVEASNSLHNILGEQELYAIKRVITRMLGVEDELTVNVENRTFYGVENQILEFKSSIVYPPANRRVLQSAVADPALQKWAIIRTICGFLNSRSGGDLLIGVRDTGYPAGIADDIKELAQRGLIPFASADHYRTYVQQQLDQAFNVENSPKTASESITRSSLSYTIDSNQEGLDILHIKVSPYKQGIVRVNKTPDRPSNIEDIYVRLSGRTVAVTPEMRSVLVRNKI